MTETARRLRRLGAPHARARAFAVVLGGLGAALAAAALTGVVLFLAGSPASGRAAAFWHPMRTWRDAHAPVRLAVDRRTVRRGGSVTATITVPGGERVTLWTRGPGEPWRAKILPLDADGHVVHQVGPIEADLFLRASSGGRRSGEIKIAVWLPAFLPDLWPTP